MADQSERTDTSSVPSSSSLAGQATTTPAPASFSFGANASTYSTPFSFAPSGSRLSQTPFPPTSVQASAMSNNQEIAALKAELVKANARRDLDIQIHDQLERDRVAARNELEDFKKKSEKDRADEVKRGAAVFRELKKLKDDMVPLEKEKNKFKRWASEERSLKEQAIAAKERAASGNVDIARESDSLRKQVGRNNTKIEDLETKIAELQQECRKCDTDRRAALDDLRKQREHEESTAKMYASINNALQKQNEANLKKYAEWPAENKRLREEIKSLTAPRLNITRLDLNASEASSSNEAGPARPASSSSFSGNFLSPTDGHGENYSDLSSELAGVATPRSAVFAHLERPQPLPSFSSSQVVRQPFSMSPISIVETSPVAPTTNQQSLGFSNVQTSLNIAPGPVVQPQTLSNSSILTTLDLAPVVVLPPATAEGSTQTVSQHFTFSRITTTLDVSPITITPPTTAEGGTQTNSMVDGEAQTITFTANAEVQTVRNEATIGTQTDFEENLILPDEIEEPDVEEDRLALVREQNEYLAREITIEELDEMVEIVRVMIPWKAGWRFILWHIFTFLVLATLGTLYVGMHNNRNLWLGANEITRQAVASFRGGLQFQNTVPISEGPWQLLNLGLRQSISVWWFYWGDNRMADYAREFLYSENVLF